MMHIIITMIRDYFYLRQRIPILLYLYYTQLKEVKDPGTERTLKIFITIIGIITSYAFTNFILGVPFSSVFPLSWHYSGMITWGIFFLIYYDVAQHSHLNKLTAFTFSTLATVGGGWLYEIPFFHPITMVFSYNAIFYLNSQIICLLLLTYELTKIYFKMNKTIYTTLSLYLVFSGMLFLNRRYLEQAINAIYPRLFSWVYRIPTCIFLISLLGGIENGEAYSKSGLR